MRIIRVALVASFASGLCGACQTPLERPANVQVGNIQAIALPGDLRLVTARTGEDGKETFCAEPSPDVARALAAALKAEGGIETPTGRQIGLGFGGSTTEALAMLSGRDAMTVALRDGLYRACEANGNGVLPRDAYGLILSQYGDLLVSLSAIEAIAGADKPIMNNVTVPNAPDVQITYPTFTAPPAKNAGDATTPAAAAPAPGAGAAAANAADGQGKDADAAAPAADPKAAPVDQPSAAPAGASDSPAQPDVSAAQAITMVVKTYMDAAEDRQDEAVLTVCVMEAERPKGDSGLSHLCTGVFQALANQAPQLAALRVQKAGYEAEQAKAAADLAQFQLAQAQAAAAKLPASKLVEKKAAPKRLAAKKNATSKHAAKKTTAHPLVTP